MNLKNTKIAIIGLGYVGLTLAVAHKKFNNLLIQKSDNCVVFDVKSFLNKELVDKDCRNYKLKITDYPICNL